MECKLAGINLHKEPVHVHHAALTREGDSPFRSICPVCKAGILLMRRDQKSLQLLEQDRCILCGQLFIYDDISKLQGCDCF